MDLHSYFKSASSSQQSCSTSIDSSSSSSSNSSSSSSSSSSSRSSSSSSSSSSKTESDKITERIPPNGHCTYTSKAPVKFSIVKFSIVRQYNKKWEEKRTLLLYDEDCQAVF